MAVSFEIKTKHGRRPLATDRVDCLVPLEHLNPRRDTSGKLLEPRGRTILVDNDTFYGYATEAIVRVARTPNGEETLSISQEKIPVGVISQERLRKGVVLFQQDTDFSNPQAIFVKSDARAGFSWPLSKR